MLRFSCAYQKLLFMVRLKRPMLEVSLRDMTGYKYLTHVQGVDHGAELVEGGPGVVVVLVEPLLRLLHRETLAEL